MRKRQLILVVGGWAAMALPVAAELAGHWLHIGDATGHVVSHFEELVVAEEEEVAQGRTFEIRVHRLSAQLEPECLEGPAAPADCSAMVVTDRGRLVPDDAARTLTISGVDILAEPFAHPLDKAGWAGIGLARGTTWDMARSGGVLDLSRSVPAGKLPDDWPGPREQLDLAKRFYLVPEGFAADLLTLAAEYSSGPVVLSGCALDALAARPQLLASVAEKAALAAPVIRQIRALQDARRAMTPDTARLVFETTVLPFLEQTGDAAAPIVPAAPFSAEAWETAVTLARFHRQSPEVGMVLFPEALPYLEDITACRDRLYGAAP